MSKQYKSVAEIQGIDKECVEICDTLNMLLGLETYESCCGHLRDKFRVFFKCNNFSTLGLLGRVTSRNYSDGNWTVVVDNGDYDPLNNFMLESKEVFKSFEEMNESLSRLCENIQYWMNPEFDDYFKRSVTD